MKTTTKTFDTEPAAEAGVFAGAMHEALAGDEAAVERFGAALGRELRKGELAVPHDIRERLRVARMAAMQAHQTALARQAAEQELAEDAAQHQRQVDAQRAGWWRKVLAVLPFAAATGVGAIFMQGAVSDDVPAQQVQSDLHLLSSDVPPSAFTDPAFMHYLKTHKADKTDKARP